MKNNQTSGIRVLKLAVAVVALALALCWAYGVPTEEKKLESIYTTTSNNLAIASLPMPIYNRVGIAGWIELSGKRVPDRNNQSITIADQGCFSAEDTLIVVKREPVVTKRDDGTWVISFLQAQNVRERQQARPENQPNE